MHPRGNRESYRRKSTRQKKSLHGDLYGSPLRRGTNLPPERYSQRVRRTTGGISTPARFPFVFIFTGKSGEQYGYKDGWTPDGTYLYTGEGQEGDMRFISGNRAIRDHVENRKQLLLFKEAVKAFVEFVGEMEYVNHQIRSGPDMSGQERNVIVFELRPLSSPARSLDMIGTTNDLKENLETFNADASNYAARRGASCWR